MEVKKKDEKRISIELIHGFGSICSKGFKDSVGLYDDDGTRSIIFPLSKHIAIKKLESSDMQLISINENAEYIQSMTMSNNKKLICLGERVQLNNGQYFPYFSIYNVISAKDGIFQERRYYSYTSINEGSFIQMRFSDDARFMVLLTGAPEHRLAFFDVTAKIKEIAFGLLYNSIQSPITKLTISPKDNHLITLSGNQTFKQYRFQEGSMNEIKETVNKFDYNQFFTDHCWVDETKIAVANNKGQVYIILEKEVIKVIDQAFPNVDIKLNEKPYVKTLIGFSKGLILGSQNGYFGIWIKSGEHHDNIQTNYEYNAEYLRGWGVGIERQQEVCSLDINAHEDCLAVSFKNNDVATLDLTKIIPQDSDNVDQYIKNANKSKKQIKFDFVYNGFHYGAITSLDVCIQRPIIATCSQKDSTIRIWNYRSFKCELARRFMYGENSVSDVNPLNCLALHPTGYIIAAGFFDKLRIFHILNNDFRPYRELVVKNSQVLRYSSGGQFLAVASPKNKGNQYPITIYHSYTMEVIKSFKGHSSIVSEMLWGPRDEFFCSAGQDGMVHLYSTSDWKRKKFNLGNTSKITTLLYNSVQEAFMVSYGEGHVGTVKSLKEVEAKDQKDQKEEQIVSYNCPSFKVTNFTFVKGYHNFPGIVGGSNEGNLMVFQSNFVPQPLQSISVHQGSITKVLSSPDGRFLFSAGEDGIVLIYKIKELSEDGHEVQIQKNIEGNEQNIDENINPKALAVDKLLADVVLVQRQEINKYLEEQKKLKNDYEDLENRLEFQSQEEKKRMEGIMGIKQKEWQNEIDALTQRYEELKKMKNDIEKESTKLLKDMEDNHLKAVEELESLYEKKLAFENGQYLKIEQELSEERMKFDKKIKEIEKKHGQNITDLNKEFNDTFSKAYSTYEKSKQSAAELRQQYEEKIAQQDEEHEMEIRDLNDRHRKEIDELKNKLAQLQTESDSYKRDNKMANEEMEKLKKEDTIKQESISRLEQKNKDNINQIEGLRGDLKKLEELLKAKEKKIHEYKYKINDLQKSKHVLSFRTTEMRKSLEPKEAQIEKLKEQQLKLENEFASQLKVNQNQDDIVKKLENKLDTKSKNNKQLREQIAATNNKLNEIMMDIYRCVNEVDKKEWDTEMQKLYQKYVKTEKIKQIHHDPKGVDEMNRQIVHLEKSIHQMNKSSEKIILRREQEIYRKTKENAELIFDLNDIRKKLKEYTQQNIEQQNKIDNLKKQNKKLTDEVGQGRDTSHKIQHQVVDDQQIQDMQQINRPQTQGGQMQQLQSMYSNFPRPQSMRITQRGKIIKGTNYDSKTLGTFDKAKMMDLLAEQEMLTQKYSQLDNQFRELKFKIKAHIQDKGCQDNQLEQDLQELFNQQVQ